MDARGNVWIGGNGNTDTQILKFDKKGKFLLQLGKQGTHNGSNDLANYWRPAKIYEDPAASEMYIADGYGNRRVIVVDRETGKYKRHWGAYGAKPDDVKVPPYATGQPPSKHFNTVHCANVSKDGFVYVCDRVNDRVQVFRKDGTFVKEAFFDTHTLRSGSVWDMTFSRDPQQNFIYMANGVDEKICIVQARVHSKSSPASVTADGSPASSSASTTWTPTRRATSTPPRPTPARAFNGSSTRAWGRSRRRRRACSGTSEDVAQVF